MVYWHEVVQKDACCRVSGFGFLLDLGFRWGLGLRGLGSGVWGLGFEIGVWGWGLGV